MTIQEKIEQKLNDIADAEHAKIKAISDVHASQMQWIIQLGYNQLDKLIKGDRT